MRKLSTIYVVGTGLIMLAMLFLIANLQNRVAELEKQCHAQCLYGDAECAARCAKAGHCPFQKED